MACKSRTLFLAAFATLFLSVICLIATNGDSAAQQSPAAPPPAKVQDLIKLLDDPEVRAWLATKTPAPPSESAETAVTEQISGFDRAIRNHLIDMRNAFPRIPSEVANAVTIVKTEINNHGLASVSALFAVLLALGFGAEWLFKRALGGLKQHGVGLAAIPGALHRIGLVQIVSEVAPLVVFFLVSAGIFLAFEWPPLVHHIILTYLVAFVAARAVLALARLLLSPSGAARPGDERAALRLIAASDIEADFWYRRVCVFAGYFLAGWATVSLLPALGFSHGVLRLIAYFLGIGLLVLAIEAVWRRPGRTAESGRGDLRDWLITAYLVLLWGLWVAGLNGLLWIGVYALLLPKVVRGAGHAAERLVGESQDAAAPNSLRTVMISRGVRALVIALAALWLIAVLRVNPNVLTADDAVMNRLIRGAVQGIIVLLVADLTWHLLKAYIDRKLAMASPDESVSAQEAARRGRLRTLLPIFRNMLAVLLATVAVLMVLSGLGVQIGPLIAGAGIFGVAIGFGSQTLVKDVISGIFYMLDDAFRVGEYIQSGSYKGTVESFSLRSVKLRHHRGPVFTVPFGVLGAVQNMSRDWVIDKFLIRVPFDTDVKKVKKLLKVIGAELKEDPELAPYIIETVKMKGVEQFGDFGMELSFAFMAKPGQQSVVRRRAYTMIRDAFAANGIDFAQPTVHVGADENAASAAAATTTHYARQKAAQSVAAADA